MSDKERFERMKAALKNILDISSDEFSRHQALWGLGYTEEIKRISAEGARE